MRILFLTPQLPYPPEKGTALRNWGLISGLSTQHEIAVLSFLDPGQSNEIADLLADACCIETVEPIARTPGERLRGMLTTRRPDMALRLAADAYGGRLAEWLASESFDVLQIEGIELAPYLDVVDEVCGGSDTADRPLVVFDDHNCEYMLQERAFLTDLNSPARWPAAAYSFVQWRRLRRYEAQVCRRADRVLAVSQADARALSRLIPGLDVTVIPNGIDTRVYRPGAVEPGAVDHSLVFTGTMDFRPNVDAVLWFWKEVWPLIRAEVPDAHFTVVGQRPHRRLDPLKEDRSVTLTGWVEDVRPYIADATVYVAPLRMGGGTRLKLLEAMAMRKPVVATSLGAEGYPITDGRELILADTPAGFAQAVVSLLNAPARRAELGRTARAFVERRYDWRVIVPALEQVYAAG
jgi:sugar transferase (PEP-CTERM/EpsH1 system associated)